MSYVIEYLQASNPSHDERVSELEKLSKSFVSEIMNASYTLGVERCVQPSWSDEERACKSRTWRICYEFGRIVVVVMLRKNLSSKGNRTNPRTRRSKRFVVVCSDRVCLGVRRVHQNHPHHHHRVFNFQAILRHLSSARSKRNYARRDDVAVKKLFQYMLYLFLLHKPITYHHEPNTAYSDTLHLYRNPYLACFSNTARFSKLRFHWQDRSHPNYEVRSLRWNERSQHDRRPRQVRRVEVFLVSCRCLHLEPERKWLWVVWREVGSSCCLEVSIEGTIRLDVHCWPNSFAILLKFSVAAERRKHGILKPFDAETSEFLIENFTPSCFATRGMYCMIASRTLHCGSSAVLWSARAASPREVPHPQFCSRRSSCWWCWDVPVVGFWCEMIGGESARTLRTSLLVSLRRRRWEESNASQCWPCQRKPHP